MAKFESPTIVQRKLKAEFGKNTTERDYIIAMFKRFCETGTVENHSGRLSTITWEKIDEVHHVTENQQQTSVQTVATACPISRTTAH